MRMMVVFEKGEQLRFIGHLDLMRTMQRALRRSGLPIKYSNGFNPHIRLSFAAPLSVGVIGLRELMEVPLEDGITEKAFTTAMNAVLPSCLQIRSCRCLDDSFPALMSLVAGADYRIVFPKNAQTDQLMERFDDFMVLESYVANRRTKSGENPCDIRPFVLSGAARIESEKYVIELRTAALKEGMLKPSLWLDSFCEFAGSNPVPALIYRTAILAAHGEERMPMEEY